MASRPTPFQSPSLLQSQSQIPAIPIRSPLPKSLTSLPFPSIQLPTSLRRTRNPKPLGDTHRSSAVSPAPSPLSIVFVKGLALSTTEERVKAVFSQFGEISRVKIIVDKRTKESLGFAYVWFASEESADTAVEGMNGKFFDGRFVMVTIARPGSCRIAGHRTSSRFRF